jgi:hypothetical protein
LLDRRLIKGVETIAHAPSKQNHPRSPVLNKKIPRVKFKEHIIFIRDFFNRKEIACDRGGMENIFKMQWM